ncbi:MAG: M13 family metallopeptidase [Terriglobales bacterium]
MAVLVSGCITVFAQSTPAQPALASLQLDHFDITRVDSTLDPCVDFYQYTCKKWMVKNPIPADQANWWLGAKLMIWNQTVVREILEKAAKDAPDRNAAEQKIGDYYASCMNETELNKKGIAPIQPELDRIAAMRSKTELPEVLAHIHALTFSLAAGTDSGAGSALFGFGSGQDFDDATKMVATVDQGGLGLPDRDYYLKTDQKSADLRQRYVSYAEKIFELLSEPPAQAAGDAKVVMDFETALAKVSMDIVRRRDPDRLNHKLSLQELQALTPSFAWVQYLSNVAAPKTDHFLVLTPDFFKGVDQLIATVPLDDWKVYLRWQLVNVSSSLLSGPFAEGRFDFYGRTLLGQQVQTPRWRRCARSVDRDLTEALGREYVARAFAADSKERMSKLVHALEAALNSDIQQAEWMNPATKKAAQAKLEKMADRIGYPDHWRDYSSLRIVRGDALGNAYRSSEFELHRQLSRIGRPIDRSEWDVSPSIPNAFYNPQLNSITFPAAILQPPLFDRQAGDEVNFAGIGAVIGHELTHGFDDQGRKFDGGGNLHDWWTAEDGKEFDRRAQCIADEYSGFDAADGIKLNGKLTLGENTADNGGLRIALMALESTLSGKGTQEDSSGFTPQQRFFIAYGETWCSNATPQYLRMVAQSNPHATAQARVNGVVSNVPEFQKAFHCKQGQPMVRENACRVW